MGRAIGVTEELLEVQIVARQEMLEQQGSQELPPKPKEKEPQPRDKDDEIDLLNFDFVKTENKENRSPKKGLENGDCDFLGLDLGLPEAGPANGSGWQAPAEPVENVDLTPLPLKAPETKTAFLDDLDEFNLFTNLNK